MTATIKQCLVGFCILLACVACSTGQKGDSIEGKKLEVSREVLLDKIKGGWAGQTIGCTYGGPTEFQYKGCMIDDTVQIPWPEHNIKWWYENSPGLYDDVYMDLTFVDVFERCGLDAPADSFAVAFANAGYPLWHANQAARYNILMGMMPPASGHWMNNPHANDIDYQIEADYAGLMTPGMPNTASEISDKIGHIMNYGDGWYGGVYVGAMYSLAFVYDDVETVVTEALKTIPENTTYYQCIADIIAWHKQYPDDWKKTWMECEKKWKDLVGCPSAIFNPFSIDASLNSAYIVIGLLYGEGDFDKTMDISTRCGQDSDCNPASAAGILGTMIGYSQIPERWMADLREVEDMDFAHTTLSLNKTYALSMKHALQEIELNGGRVKEDKVIIRCQEPKPVRYEVSFEGLYESGVVGIWKELREMQQPLTINGSGFVFSGELSQNPKSQLPNDYVADVEVTIDGKVKEIIHLPGAFHSRRFDLYHIYGLSDEVHSFAFRWLNPEKDAKLMFYGVSVYTNTPVSFILDTDLGPDYDDVGAMALMHALADSGQVKVLAAVSSNADERVVPCIEVLNTYFGRPNIPVGAPKDPNAVSKTTWHKQRWTDLLPQHYPHQTKSTADAPDAVSVYRQILSQQPDQSVVISTIGFFTNLKNLLLSKPDAYSPLTGKELVARKVKRLVSMAGRFPEGREFNVFCDTPASKVVAEEWPTEIIFSGWEIGNAILTGKQLVAMECEQNPVKEAYSLAFAEGDPDGRMSWDLTAVLVAIKGYEPYYDVERGTFRVIDAEGNNDWIPDASGKDLRLIEKIPAAEMAHILETYMMHLPQK